MKKQQGATLIMVLVILILIMLIGTFAVRSSILGLKVATNSQVQALLLNNSDSALFNVENPDRLAQQLAQGGMFNYFTSANNANDELVFCYRSSQTSFFSMSKASALSGTNQTKIGVSGYCKANEFATGRSAVISQVYLSKNVESGAFVGTPIGTSSGQTEMPTVSERIHVTVISVLPSFANVEDEKIEACFKSKAVEVSGCFKALGIPFNTQNADYNVAGEPKLIG